VPTINDLIGKHLMCSYGIDISRYDESFLEKSLHKRMAEAGHDSIVDYSSFLKDTAEEGKRFADSLHISYSGFFRNPLTFAVLERLVLPRLVLRLKDSKRKELRIWSTACAAGQEAYSLAILLEELRNGNAESFDYRIFATDHCEQQINEAREGRYFPASLSNVSLKRVGEWFSQQGGTYILDRKLQEKVDFSVFDLFNEQLSCPPASIFGDFDVVVCANLLFYYKKKFQKSILAKTVHALAEDGLLITGEAERDIVLNSNHHEVFPHSGIFRLHRS
jgi:chemotaxis protein methyltransferase CheR